MKRFISLLVLGAVGLLPVQDLSATHVAVAVRSFHAPAINYGHVVQTFSYGYTPPTVVFAAPPVVYAAPTYAVPTYAAPAYAAPAYAAPQCPVQAAPQAAPQADPPPVPAPCPATASLFAAPTPTYAYSSGVYGAYGAFRAAPVYAAGGFSGFVPNHGAVAAVRFSGGVTRFAAIPRGPVNVNVRAPGVNVRVNNPPVATFRAPPAVAVAVRTPPAVAARQPQTVIQQRNGLFGSRTSISIR